MINMTIQPLWLTHFIETLLVLEFQLTKFIIGAFSYKAHFRPQISSNVRWVGFKNYTTKFSCHGVGLFYLYADQIYN